MKAVFCGGPLNGLEGVEVELVVDFCKEVYGWKIGKHPDYSDKRKKGYMVPREELDNQPTFPLYLGPMYDGGCLRYETQEVYDAFSQ